MIKTSIYLQDLRRRIYAKAKAEPSWRFDSAVASAGSGGVVAGCTRGWDSSVSTGSGGSLRGKRLQHERSHNPWHEVSRRA